MKDLLRCFIIALAMGQAEILEFFETHPGKWYTSSDIRQHIGGTHSTVTAVLMKFRKLDLVEYKEVRNPCKKYLYKSKE